MKKIVLKYNIHTGRENQARIEALVKELGLMIGQVEERRKSPSICVKVITVQGDYSTLLELDRRLIRYPSISRKAA